MDGRDLPERVIVPTTQAESDLSLDDRSILASFHNSSNALSTVNSAAGLTLAHEPLPSSSHAIQSPQGSTATGIGSIIGKQMKTSDGKIFTVTTPEACFMKLKIQHFPEHNAKVVNVLPVPAAPFYQNTPPPSIPVGKSVRHPAYITLNDRVRSFIRNQWPLTTPSAYGMAEAGMFFEGALLVDGKVVTDQVTCYKCGKRLQGWMETDVPVHEHNRLYPDCKTETWIDKIFD